MSPYGRAPTRRAGALQESERELLIFAVTCGSTVSIAVFVSHRLLLYVKTHFMHDQRVNKTNGGSGLIVISQDMGDLG